MSKYWALLITMTIGLLLLAAVLAPILSYLGLDVIAKPLFFSMHLLCAQTPSHSFYLFGHQLCLCERCLAIYSSMFMVGLLYIFRPKSLPALPWWLWLLLVLPMVWDGGTQLFGLRESTWELRLFTGGLFGLVSMWFALPRVQMALVKELPCGL